MIKVLEGSDGNLLGIEATEKLTDEDYKKVLIPRMDEIIKKHGKARVLFQMGEEFHGWEPAAMWDDARFGMQHKNDFEKCAVVGGPKWVEWATKLGALIMSGEVKTYASDRANEAWQWIKE